MKKQAPYKSIDEYLAKKGIVAYQRSSTRDRNIACALKWTITCIEGFIFEERAEIKLLDAVNNWNIATTYHSKGREDGVYDIYIPNLIDKLERVLVLYPEKAYLRDINRKLIFIASHKIRHRLQKEKDLTCFTPNCNSNGYLIDKIIEEVKNNKNHNMCACSVLEEPNRLQEVEFDAMTTQHYVLTRLGQISAYPNLSDIPVYIWKIIAHDLLIEPI